MGGMAKQGEDRVKEISAVNKVEEPDKKSL
jgi:hypothetical protein